ELAASTLCVQLEAVFLYAGRSGLEFPDQQMGSALLRMSLLLHRIAGRKRAALTTFYNSIQIDQFTIEIVWLNGKYRPY
ncbi:MAG TPA: hypothetical protein PLZ16_06535, partial [Gammaproteobacteria bacterium]|nr:hypothetical protein [Gammaproteobacteria bacterium]